MEMQYSECVWYWWEWEYDWQVNKESDRNWRIHIIWSDWVIHIHNSSFEVESDDNY